LTTGVTGQLPVANGGTGTATPSIVAGTNVTVTGTWPNQTIAASGGGGGTPGGSTTQVQYNNAGAFGGITGATTNGTALTLVAPVLGTPASATLTNATGLPISTGVSGLGTGIATALAVNTGSAGAPVLFNGALGTPTSGTVTNLTGTASININGTVGATTANTGAFTTVTTTGSVGVGVTNFPAIINAKNATDNSYSYHIRQPDQSSSTSNAGWYWGADNNGDTYFTYNNVTAYVERLRINNSGAVVLRGGTTSANGVGITFPASMSDSTNANTLDDYEEGTWTPELADATSGGNLFTMDTQQGFYTKVGNVATLYYRVTWTSKGSASGVVRFRGFPFQAKGTTLGYYFTGATANSNGQLTTALGGNSSQAIFLDSTGGAGTVAEFSASDTGTGMNGSITYLTN